MLPWASEEDILGFRRSHSNLVLDRNEYEVRVFECKDATVSWSAKAPDGKMSTQYQHYPNFTTQQKRTLHS